MAICGQNTGYTSNFKIFQNMSIGYQQICLAQPNLTQQTVCKNIQKEVI